jgi:hypothetical protein
VAKEEGYSLAEEEEPYLYRNPVTGKRKLVLRERHDVTHSMRLTAYRQCISSRLRGSRYRGGNAAQDEEAVREAFSTAVRECAMLDKRYPSDRR